MPLFAKCEWHVKYRGYPKFLGVRSWAGWWVRFTGGICPPCRARFMEEWRAANGGTKERT